MKIQRKDWALIGTLGLGITGLILSKPSKLYSKEISSITRAYEFPRILIGYNGKSDIPCPFNQKFNSINFLEEELKRAKMEDNSTEIGSIESALNIIYACKQNNIPFSLTNLSSNSDYEGMIQESSFPTILVYCLPQIDEKKAKNAEKEREDSWIKIRGKELDVQSFHVKNNKLEKIVN